MREVRTIVGARCRFHAVITTVLIFLLHADRGAAQTFADWVKQPVPGPLPRIEDGFVYDSVANRMIMFGGYDLNWNRLNDIWYYDAGAKIWTDVTPPSGPLPTRRSGLAMAFDPVRRVVVLFGGFDDNGNFLNDTWEFDTVGRTWTQRFPATSPSPREDTRLVYDVLNNRTILVGGVDQNFYYNQTWAWNGTNWTLLSPAVSSAAGRPFAGRAMPAATYNTATNRVVVFGGIGSQVPNDLNDIWELRVGPGGSLTWTDVTPLTGSPHGRAWTQLVYDASANRIVMFGGFSVYPSAAGYADTWAFSNGAWSLIVPESSFPGERDSYGMAYDPVRQKVVVFGGYLADVIELTGSIWERVLLWNLPPGQDGHAMAYDSDRDTVFMYGGGSPESWELNVATGIWTWYYVTGPNGRSGSTVAYDSVRRRMLLFGGRQRSQGTYGSKLGDTWEWDTSAHTWTNVSPGSSPSARDGQAMAYDAAHNWTVLFGGSDANNAANGETWLWNGSSWSNVTAGAGGPPARSGHAMAYDAVRRVVVLFGGTNGSSNFNDVWEWNGDLLHWQQIFPGGPLPSPRAYAALSSFDSATPGVVMFGGVGSGSTLLNDTWIWDGSTWKSATMGTPPTPRQHSAMVYDRVAKRVVLYGGRDARGVSPDLFTGVVTSTSIWPQAISISPSQGTGAASGFYGLFRHASGASQISQVQIVINSALTGTQSVYVVYSPSSNTLALANDFGNGSTSGVVGSAGTLSNSQVTINLAYSAAWVTGTDVGLYFYAVFKNSFNGAKNIYMTAFDLNGASPAGWQQKGTFLVSSGNSVPQVVSVTPASGTGWFQDFTAVFRDPNGVGDLQQTYFVINNPLALTNAVYIYFVPATNMIYLRDDTNSSFGAGALAGTATFLSNSQVTIDVSRVAVSRGLTDLTLTFPLTFSPGFAGAKTIYMWTLDNSGAAPPPWQIMGTYNVGQSPQSGDLTIYRFGAAGGAWWSLQGSTGWTNYFVYQWGWTPDDKPLRGDFDGDGKPDGVIFRPSDGSWYVLLSSTNYSTWTSYQWGQAGDIPIPEDFDGDGRTDLVVYRPSNGVWYIRYSSNNYNPAAASGYQWGVPGDIPLSADFDGDRRADLVVFRPSSGMWYIRFSSSAYSVATAAGYQWGQAGDTPMAEDFDGDGRTDLAVWRPANGVWYIRSSTSGYSQDTAQGFQWGQAGDIPIPGDFDGDGKADLAVWRSGNWYFRYSAGGYSLVNARAIGWGMSTDVPLPPR
jgi:hypothetical protein